MRRLLLLLLTAAAAAAIVVVTTATARGPFTQRAVVVRALGGDSFLVRLPSGARERGRVLGICAPSGGRSGSRSSATGRRAHATARNGCSPTSTCRTAPISDGRSWRTARRR